jgi:hypothetical protein
MTVTIPIPQWASLTLEQCGYNTNQIESIFTAFITELISNDYSQTATDFDNWLNSDDFEDVCEYIGIEAK